LTITEASTGLGELRAQRLDVVPVTSLVDDALALAAAHDISAYDAASVAASVRNGVSLITADARLVSKLAGTPYRVDLLGGLTIPAPPPTSTGS
jgi:predicted nucleic acid-binding protein